ncbi:virulence factor esxA, partial [Staphylococcus aureus M1164]
SPKVEKFAQLLEEIKQQLNSTADAVQEQKQQVCNNFGLQ